MDPTEGAPSQSPTDYQKDWEAWRAWLNEFAGYDENTLATTSHSVHGNPDKSAARASRVKPAYGPPDYSDPNLLKRPASKSPSPKPVGKNPRNQSPAQLKSEDSIEEYSALSGAPSQLSAQHFSKEQESRPLLPHQLQQEIQSDGEDVYGPQASASNSKLPLDPELRDAPEEEEGSTSKKAIRFPKSTEELKRITARYTTTVLCICGLLMNGDWLQEKHLNPCTAEFASTEVGKHRPPWKCVGAPDICKHPADLGTSCQNEFHCNVCNMHYETYRKMFGYLEPENANKLALKFFEQHKSHCDRGLMDAAMRRYSEGNLLSGLLLEDLKPSGKRLLRLIVPELCSLFMCQCGGLYSRIDAYKKHHRPGDDKPTRCGGPMTACPPDSVRCADPLHCDICHYHFPRFVQNWESEKTKHIQNCPGQTAMQEYQRKVCNEEYHPTVDGPMLRL